MPDRKLKIDKIKEKIKEHYLRAEGKDGLKWLKASLDELVDTAKQEATGETTKTCPDCGLEVQMQWVCECGWYEE